MAALVAVGLDGYEIPPEVVAAITAVETPDDEDGTRHAIAVMFDNFPKWARDAIREFPQYDIKISEIAPAIYSGQVNQFNIRDQIRANDSRWRAHFREQDRKNGLA